MSGPKKRVRGWRRAAARWSLGLLAAVAAVGAGRVRADHLELVGHAALRAELGEGLPVGEGVLLTQVEETSEADGGGQGWAPDPDADGLEGKRFPLPSLPSKHATTVGRYFYGSASLAPGVEGIECYPARFWATEPGGFLRTGSGRLPLVSRSRIANHSWIAKPDPASALEVLKRLDYVVAVDDFIQVAGANNKPEIHDLVQGSYNAIIVGTSNGRHSVGTNDLGRPLYGPHREKPDLVAPMPFTSEATPLVASAAAMLVGFAHAAGPSISKGSYLSPRSGRRIYHAEASEVIKAVLMAGAVHRSAPPSARVGRLGRRGRRRGGTDGGSVTRRGAGQLNVRNSYHILAAGEQDAVGGNAAGTPAASSRVNMLGFDYNPAFGGAEGSGREARYCFTAPDAPCQLKAVLAWNLKVNEGGARWDGKAELYDLDLKLFDLDRSAVLPVATSDSWIDNTESIWAQLAPGHTYELRVVCARRQADFLWDYALAWRVAPPG